MGNKLWVCCTARKNSDDKCNPFNSTRMSTNVHNLDAFVNLDTKKEMMNSVPYEINKYLNYTSHPSVEIENTKKDPKIKITPRSLSSINLNKNKIYQKDCNEYKTTELTNRKGTIISMSQIKVLTNGAKIYYEKDELGNVSLSSLRLNKDINKHFRKDTRRYKGYL